jgi:hypothetical protein
MTPVYAAAVLERVYPRVPSVFFVVFGMVLGKLEEKSGLVLPESDIPYPFLSCK